MMPSLQTMTLRSRIYVSTGLLVAICCVSSGISWFGQTAVLSKIDDYEQAEFTSSQVLAIDRSVQELKAKSESYLHSGSESARHAAERLLEKLFQKIERNWVEVIDAFNPAYLTYIKAFVH